MRLRIIALFFFLSFNIINLYGGDGFTQQDRERLIKLETTLNMFMKQTDKRFFELREDMNKRFEQVDRRFEQIDKRFEQVDKRFRDLINFLWMIVGIFTAIMVGSIGFAYWDRTTVIRKAKSVTIDDIEREGKVRDIIKALRELANINPELKKLLKDYHLL